MAVRYRLDRKLKGESEFTLGEVSDKYEIGVPLSPGDPTGLYVFNIVLLPTNGLGEAVLDSDRAVLSSVATVGVLRVSSVMTNTVIATPWASMSVDVATNLDIAVSDVVNPNGIFAADQIYSYDSETTNFNSWVCGADGSWEPVVTVTKRGVSESIAEETQFPPGHAFWLVRSNPSDPGRSNPTNYIYLVGRYTGEGCEMELASATNGVPGNTLCANPTMFDVGLNAIEFVDGEGKPATPDVGDRITVMNIAGLETTYCRNAGNTEWGYYVKTKVNGRIRNLWTTGTIPSGTGFWYTRTGANVLKIKFKSSD